MPEAVVEMVGRVSKASSRAKALTWTPELAQNKDQVHRMAYPDDPSFSPSYHSRHQRPGLVHKMDKMEVTMVS